MSGHDPRPALTNEAVQSWMQAAIVHPGGVVRALASPEAGRLVPPERASSVIRERGGLTAAERLEIYAAQYPLRMAEALRSDYPALAALLGPARFEKLVADYVAGNPSRSFTLARLGDRLPAFVAEWGSRRGRGLAADVARLERAATKVFDADEGPLASLPDFEGLAPDAWESLELAPAAAFALLPVRAGAVAVLDAFLEGTSVPARPGRGKAWVAFYRAGFEVRRRTLGRFPGLLLEGLVSGVPLARALSSAAARSPERPGPAETASWVADWLRLGFFAKPGSGRRERSLPD